MKILITADLHLNIPARHPRTGRTAFEVFAQEVKAHRPDAVVIAGDLGIPHRAQEWMAALRGAIGSLPFAFCLGNHDLWANPADHAKFVTLTQIAEAYWLPAAKMYNAVLLDFENAYWDDFTVCGGYGHFDLGLAEPDLQIEGVRVTREHYLSGGLGTVYWNDFSLIPHCKTRLPAHAKEQVHGIEVRLTAAIASAAPLLVATHTCPWRELNGHVLGGTATDLFQAYSGNSMIGDLLSRHAASIDLFVCGHTHYPVREISLFDINCLNIGADYGVFRGILYDSNTRIIQWIGESFSWKAY